MNERAPIIFISAGGFIAGAILGGLGLSPLATIVSLIVCLLATRITKIFKPYWFIIVALVLLGNFYYHWDNSLYQQSIQAVKGEETFPGQIISSPQPKAKGQLFKLRLETGQIFVWAANYPELKYGDVIIAQGKLSPPPEDSYGRYLAKERVAGTLFYPQIEVLGNNGNRLMRSLNSINQKMATTLDRLFNQFQASFLAGILFGDRSGFSPDFLEQLSLSGTMHLTALSGLHLTIIIVICASILSTVFRNRRWVVFLATFVLIGLFVAMTGFKISALRAAIMALIAGLATQTGRLYNPSRAIMVAALLITLGNPKAPTFDLAFQLSFAAVISIIYFSPVIKRLRFFQTESFLDWRNILAITMAAQIGVAPITIAYFGNFSFSALPANVAILIIMPVLMALGFASILASWILPPLAYLLAQPTAFLIDYASAVIGSFYTLRLPFNPTLGLPGVLVYYGIMIWLAWRYQTVNPQDAKLKSTN